MGSSSLLSRILLALLLLILGGCQDHNADHVPPEGFSPERLGALQHLAQELRARSLAQDTAFCDSVLPLFQRADLARAHPQLVIDAHEAALNGYGYQPSGAEAAYGNVANQLGDDRSKAYYLTLEGFAALHRGDLGAAMRHGLEALPLARMAGDSGIVAKASKLIGTLLCDYLDQPTDAMPHLHRYFALSISMDERVTAAHFISEAYWQLDDLENAQQQLDFVERHAVEADSAWPGYPFHRIQGAFLRFVIEARRASMDPSRSLAQVREAFDSCIGLLDMYSTARAWNTVAPCVRFANLLIARGEFAEADPVLRLAESYATRCEVCAETIPDLHAAFAELHKRTGRVEEAIASLERRINAMARNDLLMARQNARNAAAATAYEQRERTTALEQERERLRADQRLTDERVRRNIFLFSGLGLLVFGVVVYRQRGRIKKEHERSEELLLNILPEEVAEELKVKGEAEARSFDQVTVLFTDFKGFTAMSEKVTPKQLVRDLHECFSAFDRICAKHGIEKIKTIGDAYMAAGGLPTPNSTHAMNAINAALEMRDFIAEGKARKVAGGLPYFEIRIGIHTGPVVAGIVGVKKFAYDIWGDTVNIASRMESSGEVGQVNISEATYALVKDAIIDENGVASTHRVDQNRIGTATVPSQRPEFIFTPRGKVQAKGKGEMEMYFVRHSGEAAKENFVERL